MGFCQTCGDRTTKRCSRCQSAYYCTADCQRMHWASHKPKCQTPADAALAAAMELSFEDPPNGALEHGKSHEAVASATFAKKMGEIMRERKELQKIRQYCQSKGDQKKSDDFQARFQMLDLMLRAAFPADSKPPEVPQADPPAPPEPDWMQQSVFSIPQPERPGYQESKVKAFFPDKFGCIRATLNGSRSNYVRRDNVCLIDHDYWEHEMKDMEQCLTKEEALKGLIPRLEKLIPTHPIPCSCMAGVLQWGRAVDLVVSLDRKLKEAGHYPYDSCDKLEQWVLDQVHMAYSILNVVDSPHVRPPGFVRDDPHVVHVKSLELEPRPDNVRRWKESHIQALQKEIGVTREEALSKLDEREGDTISALVSLRFALAAQYDKESCTICLESIQGWNGRPRHLPCGHFFHHKCVEEWLARQPTCPNCREKVVK